MSFYKLLGGIRFQGGAYIGEVAHYIFQHHQIFFAAAGKRHRRRAAAHEAFSAFERAIKRKRGGRLLGKQEVSGKVACYIPFHHIAVAAVRLFHTHILYHGDNAFPAHHGGGLFARAQHFPRIGYVAAHLCAAFSARHYPAQLAVAFHYDGEFVAFAFKPRRHIRRHRQHPAVHIRRVVRHLMKARALFRRARHAPYRYHRLAVEKQGFVHYVFHIKPSCR